MIEVSLLVVLGGVPAPGLEVDGSGLCCDMIMLRLSGGTKSSFQELIRGGGRRVMSGGNQHH